MFQSCRDIFSEGLPVLSSDDSSPIAMVTESILWYDVYEQILFSGNKVYQVVLK